MSRKFIMAVLAGMMLFLGACGQDETAAKHDASLALEEAGHPGIAESYDEEDFEGDFHGDLADAQDESLPMDVRIQYDAETPFEENEYISIFLQEYWQEKSGVTLTLNVVNNSSQTIYLTCEDGKINGLDAKPYTTFSSGGIGKLEPGESITMQCKWDANVLKELGIDGEVNDLMFSCALWEYDSMKIHDFFWKKAFVITPEAEEPVALYQREVQENEIPILDNEYGLIIYKGIKKEGENFELLFYVENRTDEFVSFQIEDIVVNGTAIKQRWAFEQGGNSFYEDYGWYLVEAFSGTESLEFTLNVYSLDTHETYFSERITLNP